MATALEIITQAYRDPNIIAVGKQPTSAEIAEAVPLLNTILKNVFGRKMGNFTDDWPLGTFYTAPNNKRFPFWDNNSQPEADVWRYPPQNKRLLVRLKSPTTIYFEPYPDDGAQMILVDNGNDWAANPLTVDFNGRTGEVQNVSTQTVTFSTAPTAPIHWMYRADQSRWVEVPTLDKANRGSEQMPFPPEFDDWFSITLATRLAPRYSKQIDPVLVATLQDLSKQMETRYRQTARVNVHRRGEDQRTLQTLGFDGVAGGEPL